MNLAAQALALSIDADAAPGDAVLPEPTATADPAEDTLSDQQLWAAWRDDGSAEARELLVLRHLPFARRVAWHTMRKHRIQLGTDTADVHQSAVLGLIQAIDRFDPRHGVRFTTFATYRIEGEVLDSLGKLNEMQQQISARSAIRRERLASLRPHEATPQSRPERIVDALAAVSMSLALGFILEDSNLFNDPDQPSLQVPSAYDSLAWKQTIDVLHRLVNSLGDMDRKVLAYHYFQGLAFEQVALLMGLSRGRISQIHRQALERLRERMGPDSGLNASL